MNKIKVPIPPNLFVLFIYLTNQTNKQTSMPIQQKLIRITENNDNDIDSEIMSRVATCTMFVTIALNRMPFTMFQELQRKWTIPTIFGYHTVSQIQDIIHTMGWNSQSTHVHAIRSKDRNAVAKQLEELALNRPIKSHEFSKFISDIHNINYFGIQSIERTIITPENGNQTITSLTVAILWSFTWSLEMYSMKPTFYADCYCLAIY